MRDRHATDDAEAEQRFIRRYLRAVPPEQRRHALAGAVGCLLATPSPPVLRRAVEAVRFGGAVYGATAKADAAIASAYARAGQARMLIELGDFESAGTCLAEALQDAPQAAWIVETAGYLALYRGDRDAAAMAFGKARECDPASVLGAPGLAALAQMGSPWPADRRHLATGDLRPSRATSELDLVFFFVERHDVPRPAQDLRWFMAHVFQTARRACPGAAISLMTDEHTTLPRGLPVDRLIRSRIDARHSMLERMRLQLEYLSSHAADRNIVFLDPDILLTRDLATVFEEGFDIALTYRRWPYPQHPFNGGVIFVRSGDVAARFFSAALACYRESAGRSAPDDGDLRAWWGDQLALARLVDWSFYAQTGPVPVSVEGAQLSFLPWWTHNYTPLSLAELHCGDPADVFLIHFKGDAKTIMHRYLQRND